ncbi:MAG TPA: 50S ribosomal protein L6 [Candidatus Onthomorpha intestinigallinarum]|uniref:Large ribosomal subunit protein uL6 n=1 Tax=Candidatus Onthomorpha intestinigallinarum TaxID=2840880 RepID=A0A9D1RGX4_9BACT|nr:50S ribosomal protein L6 [Candidatus Onthomorpha intestinigallinarum]
MSRIGRLPISLPKGVEVIVDNNNLITVKGTLGTLTQKVDPAIKVEVADNVVSLTRETDQKEHRAMHGLYRALIANMVKGVSEGFKTVQEVIGVGYKAQVQGQILELSLGFSHNVYFELPKEIKCETVTEKGKDPLIIMTSIDKQLLGQVAAKIRSLRKPEPYKGKGIRFQGEIIRKKAGKAAAK